METRGMGNAGVGRVRRALHDLAPVTLVAGALAMVVALVVGGTTAGIVGPGAQEATVATSPAAGPPELHIRPAPARPRAAPSRMADAALAAAAPQRVSTTLDVPGEPSPAVSTADDQVALVVAPGPVSGAETVGAVLAPVADVATALRPSRTAAASASGARTKRPRAKGPDSKPLLAATAAGAVTSASGAVADVDATPAKRDEADHKADKAAGKSAEAHARAPGLNRPQD